MPDLMTISQALADVLNGVGPEGQGIRATATMPSTVNPPAAVVTLPPGATLQYQALGSPPSAQYTLRVTVLASIGDNAAADTLLRTYLSTSGPGSLLQALSQNPNLGGAVDWAIVQSVHGFGWVEWAGLYYLGAQIAVQVGVSG
jgi:hypothetical protein